MVIDSYLIHYKRPNQYLYWGEKGVDIYRLTETEKKQKFFQKIRSIPNISLLDITYEAFQDIRRDLLNEDTGVLFNSGQFIFNIFEFEKIPFQHNLKKDLVEWRLKKVFPENLDDYAHDFFKLSKKRVLSVLFKKSIKVKIEELFHDNDLPLIFMGNSTIEIINQTAKRKTAAPDFIIETDKSLTMLIFLQNGIPYYFRKFRSGNAEGIISEVAKTVNFVKSSYSKIPTTYTLAADPADTDFNFMRDELAKQELRPLDMKNKEQLLFIQTK
jgi:hypothetical protein